MDLLKETALETIKKMPEGSSVEDIMCRIDFIGQVLEGMRDADAGRTITTAELLERIEGWQK